MATYEKKFLSGDSFGSGIWLNTSASPITIHTTGTSNTIIDEAWVYMINGNANNSATITVSIAGNNNYIELPADSGMVLAIPGLPICGTGSNTSTIEFTDNDSTGSVYVYGYVNRITP